MIGCEYCEREGCDHDCYFADSHGTEASGVFTPPRKTAAQFREEGRAAAMAQLAAVEAERSAMIPVVAAAERLRETVIVNGAALADLEIAVDEFRAWWHARRAADGNATTPAVPTPKP